LSDLYRYIDKKQLTAEFDGSLQFIHHDWIQHQLVQCSLTVS